jgi:hypothetical protein
VSVDATIVNKKKLLQAIEAIRDQSREEDEHEDALIGAPAEGIGDFIEDDDLDETLMPVLSLAQIPLDEWNSVVLSKSSKFGHSLWDFTAYPHVNKSQVRVNFDFKHNSGINLVEPKYCHWLRISKALIFYSIPHFAVSNYVRSYGSLSSRKARVLRLLSLFQRERLYLGNLGDKGFRTINDLSPDLITQFILQQPSVGKRWELAHSLQFWQQLSFGKLLPVEYGIHSRIVKKEDVARYRSEYDEASSPYLPIPLDEYANIINHCVRMVEEYSKDILWLYETYYPMIVGGFEHADRAALRPGGISPSGQAGVAAFSAYEPVTHEGQPWWPLKVDVRSKKQYSAVPSEFISSHKINSLIASLFDACCVTILATTGMRRSEVMGLRSGCVSNDSDGYWLRYTVFKTSRASQGDVKRIPIPAITAKAIAIVEQLCHEGRTYGGHDALFTSITRQHFGKPTHLAYPQRAVKRVSEAVGADLAIHPHRFRKTLAMYLIYQDPTNIEVVRQLFSHVSLKMTLRYVMSLPGVNNEMKKIILEQNIDVLLEVLEGALNGRIGGQAGKRIKESIEASPKFVARLQDKGKEALVQYVESMLEQGIKILHRTNLAICLKTPGYVESAPCDGKNEDPSTKLHPNLFACDPFNCRFAAFVESNIPALRNEVLFHNKLLTHPFSSNNQKKFSERRIAEVMKRLSEVGDAEGFAKEPLYG